MNWVALASHQMAVLVVTVSVSNVRRCDGISGATAFSTMYVDCCKLALLSVSTRPRWVVGSHLVWLHITLFKPLTQVNIPAHSTQTVSVIRKKKECLQRKTVLLSFWSVSHGRIQRCICFPFLASSLSPKKNKVNEIAMLSVCPSLITFEPFGIFVKFSREAMPLKVTSSS
jgi:hypothetical protein